MRRRIAGTTSAARCAAHIVAASLPGSVGGRVRPTGAGVPTGHGAARLSVLDHARHHGDRAAFTAPELASAAPSAPG
ncbi:MAG: hypothetical protein F4139_07660 [Gemmatimonadetes bacterium]|nr:hypothetical protein [Gemmatimonadota bacterium]MYH52812.1 hypothetical protein [Gemmatimonadota bacterium]